MMTATYSPDDNKLRLYSSTRLDAETYKRVKDAGFKFAPKQDLFVAPMWTPEREDLLVELCGEIGDEDTSLADRAEQRADRFGDYSHARRDDAEQARKAVDAIANNIPLGQPILVGHHSERRARKDAERIENGMRKTVQLWQQSEYWRERAKGAIRHAKYKERPDVRARRIRGLEADKRRHERTKAEAEKFLKAWSRPGLTQEQALMIANYCHLTLARKEGDRPDFNQRPSAYDALRNSYPNLYAPRTLEEVIAAAKEAYPKTIAHVERWLGHLELRLTYERTMLADAGGTVADKTGPEKGGGCKCWASHRGGWSYIQKVNQVSVTVLDNWGNGGGNFTRTIPFDKLTAIMTKAEVDEKRAAGLLVESDDKTGFFLLTEKPKDQRRCKECGRLRSSSYFGTGDGAEVCHDCHLAKPFTQIREQLQNGVEVVAANQLFPTPPAIAARMVELAEIDVEHYVLEPSAGTGNLVRAIRERLGSNVHITAVEPSPKLTARLAWIAQRTHVDDFLSASGAELGTFDRILMNPPFQDGADIKHIKHALTMLRPGGRLVAICANGSRQNEILRPLASTWERLPAEAFREQGTGVQTVLLTIQR